MLIKNANILKEDGKHQVDIRVDKGVITEISKNITPSNLEKVIDAKDKYILPKLIDTNVRVLDDTLSKKNLEKLYEKAKKGGVGSFVLIDDFTPKVENATHLELLSSKVSNVEDIDIILSVNSLNKENRLNNIATFLKNGAKVIYTRSDINGNTLVRVMQYANMKNVPLFCFALDDDIKNQGVMNEGDVSFKLGLPGISKIAQISEVSKMVELATFFDVKVLFQGLFSAKSLQILKAVKKSNKKVYTEVSIHNLILTDKECEGYNTQAKLIAPLQESEEKDRLIKYLKEGVVDIISSSHSSKSYIYKDVAFEDAKEGVDALSLTLRLGYTYLVKKGIVSLYDFINMVSKNPAEILSLDKKGRVKVGYKADLILFDPEVRQKVEDEASLYYGKELYGSIEEIKE